MVMEQIHFHWVSSCAHPSKQTNKQGGLLWLPSCQPLQGCYPLACASGVTKTSTCLEQNNFTQYFFVAISHAPPSQAVLWNQGTKLEVLVEEFGSFKDVLKGKGSKKQGKQLCDLLTAAFLS